MFSQNFLNSQNFVKCGLPAKLENFVVVIYVILYLYMRENNQFRPTTNDYQLKCMDHSCINRT